MSLTLLVQDKAKILSNLDWEIYHYLDEVEDIAGLTIQQVAGNCHVSTTTIFRFCQKLGLAGFSELKATLKLQTKLLSGQQNFPELYHQIIQYIHRYDTSRFFQALVLHKAVYLYAQTDKELRVAKEIERIFLQSQLQMFILPNPQALENYLKQDQASVLWVIRIDGDKPFPAIGLDPQTMEVVYCLVMTDKQAVQILYDDLLMIPELDRGQFPHLEPILTPFMLAVEILFLKFRLLQ
ncbi:MurR/RpiR family transcriptional regulator [Streptococcus merionis]|uniref:MurR/RpiR family transcriptional regulator n=1 Tax=Streptococcus merionis TaxID=400065 RepID=UPI0035137DED